jgi:hypothetical protein
MASILLGAVGSAIAGPIGGMIGGQAGSMLDSLLLNHKTVRKPTLQDLIVEAATMGLPIPANYGRNKIAGNLIQSDMLQAEKHSGKGTGSKGTPYYTYNVTCAVAICRGPIYSIWRIFADSKLIWDMDPEVTGPGTSTPGTPLVQSGWAPNSNGTGGVATLYHYGTGKNSNNQFAGSTVNFYFGTEDQGPDGSMSPLATAATGFANSQPGYRGIAYAVFNGLPLQDYGNRIPNFSFEINGYYIGANNIVTSPAPTNPSYDNVQVYYDVVQQVIYAFNEGALQIYNAQTAGLIYDDNATGANLSQNTIVLQAMAPFSGNVLVLAASMNNAQGAPDGTMWMAFSTDTVGNPAGVENTAPGLLLNVSPSTGPVAAYPLIQSTPSATEVSPGVYTNSIAIGPINQSFPEATPPGPPPAVGDAGASAYCTSAQTIMVFGASFNTWQAYDMSGGAPVLTAFGYLPGATGYHFPTLSWDDAGGRLVVATGNQVWTMLVQQSGQITISDPCDVYPTFTDNGAGYVPLFDAVANCFIFTDGYDMYSVVDPTTLVPQAHINFVAAYGFPMLNVDPWFVQQLPQGSIAVIIAGTGVYGGIVNGPNNSISGGPGPGFGATSGDQVSGGGTGGGNVYILSSTTLAELSSVQTDGWTWTAAEYYVAPNPVLYNPWGNGYMDYVTNNGVGWAIYHPNGYPISLATIVQDICLECGLTIQQINVEALANTIVYGYVISQEASGRAAIEPLQEIYQFDLVEIDGVLTGVFRATENATIAVTIAEADLGARSATAEIGANPQPKVIEKRKQDVEIPQYVFLRYRTAGGDFYVKNFSFEIATQYAKRAISPVSTVYGMAHQSFSSTLVLDDQQAANIVLQILLLQYLNRTSYQISLPINYISITPGDVIQLNWHDTEGNLVSVPVYVQQADIGADNTIKISGVACNGAIYQAQNSTNNTVIYGGPLGIPTPGQGLPVPPPAGYTPQAPLVQGAPVAFPGFIPMNSGQSTTVELLEIPPIADTDDTAGFYWTAGGVGVSGGWGCSFVTSVNGGSSYVVVGTESIPGVLGSTTNQLGDAKNSFGNPVIPGLWDDANTVNIRVTAAPSNSLASVEPVNVENQENIFVIGNEIVGAANVVQEADGTYTLSLLQRGLLGTDIYIADHAPGERAIMLTGILNNDTLTPGAIGNAYLYAGISVGGDITTSHVFSYSLKGTRIRPEEPCHVTLLRDTDNNAMVVWTPRNRINYQWIDGTEQASDEAIEAYQVDIISQGAVARTLTDWFIGDSTVGSEANQDSGLRMVPYTAAEQEEDGLVGAGATFDTGSLNHNLTLSAGNLQGYNGSGGTAAALAGSPTSAGKYYSEFTFVYLTSNNTGCGVATAAFNLNTEIGSDNTAVGIRAVGGVYFNNISLAAYTGIRDTNTVGIAVDVTNQLIWFQTAGGAWNGDPTADPATGVGGCSFAGLSGDLYMIYSSTSPGEHVTANFGATPFTEAVPAGFSAGWPGPLTPLITANIYSISSRVGRGFPATITG